MTSGYAHVNWEIMVRAVEALEEPIPVNEVAIDMVGAWGFDPQTPTVSRQCSTPELRAYRTFQSIVLIAGRAKAESNKRLVKVSSEFLSDNQSFRKSHLVKELRAEAWLCPPYRSRRGREEPSRPILLRFLRFSHQEREQKRQTKVRRTLLTN